MNCIDGTGSRRERAPLELHIIMAEQPQAKKRCDLLPANPHLPRTTLKRIASIRQPGDLANEDPWLCAPASRPVCLFVELCLSSHLHRGGTLKVPFKQIGYFRDLSNESRRDPIHDSPPHRVSLAWPVPMAAKRVGADEDVVGFDAPLQRDGRATGERRQCADLVGRAGIRAGDQGRLLGTGFLVVGPTYFVPHFGHGGKSV